MSTQHQDQTIHPSIDPARGTISCIVCQAAYAPSPSHAYLLQAPPVALESAFMGMCHFCFRCRRPACPGCWDDVHGVCGLCAQEAHLPFRAASPPLSNLLFAPARQAQLTRERPLPAAFVCVQPGCLQESAPIDMTTTLPVKTTAQQQAEQAGKKRQGQSVSQAPIAAPFSDVDQLPTRPQRARRAVRNIERFLTVVLLVLLLAIIMLVIVASVSANANTFIAGILHVDIRAEIAYLLQLISHLH